MGLLPIEYKSLPIEKNLLTAALNSNKSVEDYLIQKGHVPTLNYLSHFKDNTLAIKRL